METIDLEIARKKLESILNSEIVGAKAGYDFIVDRHIEYYADNGRIICCGGEPDEDTKKLMKEFEKERVEIEKRLRAKIEDIRKEQIQGVGRIILRATEPYFIAKGSHQAVINLGNNLVAKLGYEEKFSSDEYLSVSFAYPYVKETADTLKSMGFSIPDLGFLRMGWNNEHIEVSADVSHDSYRRHTVQRQRLFKRTRKKPVYYVGTPTPKNLPNVCVMRDLRENGRYQVSDFEEETAKKILNGCELINEYERYFSQLIGIYNKERIYLKPDSDPFIVYNPHSDNTPEEAIKRMFLLQVPIDKKDLGKLIIGDLDHINVFR